jgi:hypothetical protein
MASDRGDAKSRAALDSMRVDITARQRVINAAEVKRQQQEQAEAGRRYEQERQQQQVAERARLEKEACMKKTDAGPSCTWRCLDPNGRFFGQTIPGCVDSCENRKQVAVAACNGVYLAPAPVPQQINIQQAPMRLPNPNACIQDGGSTMCMGR